jgi:DNA-binding response OmpR family regulator
MARAIMLVEDNEDDLFFMKLAMKKAEIDNPLYVAPDGQHAIEFLARTASGKGTSAIPCLIVLDLKLPKVAGHEVLKWIRQQPFLKTVPVIVLSASRDDRDIETAYELGANSYFAKPSDIDGLVEMVKLLRDYWLKHCIPPPVCVEGPAEVCRV